MRSIPDYSSYHLHELEEALKDIDESSNPEEARTIREFIARGGYVYPTEPPIERVCFANAAYKWSLVVVLTVLLSLNLIIFASAHYLRSLIPIVLQGTILFMIYRNHKYTRMLIKIWCGLLILSALFGFLAMYYAPAIEVPALAEHGTTLVVGLVFLVLANRYVHLIPVRFNKPPESTR